ncbi:outer membrane receptor protein involved in Fe transport [Pseudoduganella flava]|uniref:Outer membrane receptor protein involved in Fe transport n=1 Tax=Pseudoduganella flava TaxID=871742 RepID=A0A562Q3G3_9BURK|nr:TonB-dependent receptor [Pseudoduganella flava]QGZ41318.1 TonB-dependent receptor plug domain-containing protein [Pseudoduganella flava]TWI51262.1 outer membrane receptor protein involved in Fe transport [Pseudoduganella flava]
MKFPCTRMGAAVSLALLQMNAFGQEAAAPAAPAQDDGLQMNRVVVTGTAAGTSKMKSSVSVSTLEADTIAQSVPTSAADVLRAVPGVRSESSGGEGNANMTVRGVPISAGGSRYVQIQEDGLPVLQSGDFNFITPDAYVRVDGGLSHLEVVRGGSASTLATNAPGGIINFIGKTGEKEGGSIGFTTGVDYDSKRVDFDYGGRVAERTRFFVAGFYRRGEGVRETGVTSEKGGQLSANVTREFDNGYVRLSFKHLDDHTPTALPVPVSVTNGRIAAIDGIDPRTVSFYSPYWVPDVTLDKSNRQVAHDVNDGMHVRSNTFGLEAQFDLGGGWTVTERLRKANNSGRFIGVFAGNNGSVGQYVFATGPQAGQAYAGRAFAAVVFNTSIDDAGLFVNDTKLARTFALANGTKLTATAGLYASDQDLGLTWNFNEYLMQASGDKPALLRTANATPGLVGPAFGACCSRAIDMEYKYLAPYLNLGYEAGPWNVDASVRHDRQSASGTANIATGAQRYEPATVQRVDYDLTHNSYSAGANYRLSNNLALFARASEGVAFNADRILFGAPLDGSVPVSINTVRQLEGGVKWKRGGVSAFVTAFHAKTRESNYEVTTRTSTANSYDAKGVEIEAAWRAGALQLNGGLTLTDAEITATAPGGEAVIGNTPRRQAHAVYQAAATYSLGKALLGASVIGTGKSWADDQHTIVMPAYRTVSAFVNYDVSERVMVSLSANNLFNETGYTEVEGDGHAARSIAGRSIKASVKYSF